MKPLSNDLRERILAAVDNHEGSRRKLAARFAVNVSTITRLLQLRRQTGSFEPRPHGGGVAPTLDHDGLERLRDLVEETPDATLEALKQKLGISGSIMIICRALQKLGLPLKKKSRHAAERDTPEVQQKRRSFRRKVEPIEPKRLVFVDETGVTTAMTPAYGRAPRGERVEASAPASWESVTVIAAMGLDGVRAPLALPGVGQRGDLRVVRGAGPRAGVASRGRGGLRQPEVAPGPGGVRGDRAGRGERAAAAAVQPGLTRRSRRCSRSSRSSCRRVGARAKEHLYEAIGEGLREVTTRGHPRLVPACRLVCNPNVNRCKRDRPTRFVGPTLVARPFALIVG